MRKVMVLAALLFGLSGGAVAQKLKIEPDQRYLLLAAEKTSTMQREIDEAAALGFRIVTGSPTSGSEIVLLLERVAHPPETYTYRLIATNRTGAFQKELDAAAREGFRLLPTTMVAKETTAGKFLGGLQKEIVAVLERGPKADRRYEYKLLATIKTATLQKEVGEASGEGFTLIGIVSRDEHMVIMEREVPAQPVSQR